MPDRGVACLRRFFTARVAALCSAKQATQNMRIMGGRKCQRLAENKICNLPVKTRVLRRIIPPQG